MKKTKAEIMEEINKYAKKEGKEITPSFIVHYLMEELKISKASAYRFLRKNDTDFISFTQKKYEKRDNIDYTNEEFEEITIKAFDILHKKNLNSSKKITLDEIIAIAESIGTEPRYLACNILGIDTKNFDKLVTHQCNSTKLSLGLGFKDDKLAEKVKELRHELIQTSYGKSFTLEEIKEMSEKYVIPLPVCLKKVYNLTRAQIIGLYSGKKIKFLTNKEFIDYKYNDLPSKEDLSEKIVISEENEKTSVFTDEDKEDSILEEDDFYNIDANSQEEFIESLNIKKEQIKLKNEYLIKKYDAKYSELLRKYRELNITEDVNQSSLPSTKRIFNSYVKQLKEIIRRNPKYYSSYPLKLKYTDFLKIADDFQINPKTLLRKMFNDVNIDVRKQRNNAFFRMNDKSLPPATNFYILFQDDLEQAIKSIVYRTIKTKNGNFSNADDLGQILRMSILKYGNSILFYGGEAETKEDYLQKIFCYLKGVCSIECELMENGNASLDQGVKEGSETTLGELIPDKGVNVEQEAIGSIFDRLDSEEDISIINNVLIAMQEEQERGKALEKVAKNMGISVEELGKILDDIYSRLK